jgi:hypothetical protein
MQVDRFDLAGAEAQLGAHLLQQGQVAAAAVAEAELRPIQTSRAPRRCTSNWRTKVSAGIAAIAASKRSRPIASTPSSRRISTLLRARVSRGGGVPWRRIHAAAARTPRPPRPRPRRARATAWRTSARWPRWRPSNAPIQTTLPLGNSSPPSTLLNSLLINSRSGPTGAAASMV